MKRYKLKEIAESAKVSVSTVSRVLNNPEVVSDRAREAVYAAISRMNAGLPVDNKVQVRKTILIMLSNFSHPIHYKMLESITRTAYENGYSVSVYLVNNRLLSFDELYTVVTDTNAAGIILLTCVARLRNLEELCRLLPIVHSGELPQNSPLSSVSFNYYEIFRRTTLRCIALGKRHPGILHLKRYLFTELPSVAGFLDALKESNLPYDRSLFIFPESFDYMSIYEELDLFFRRKPVMDVLLCENDALAVAASSAARKNGFRVPENLMIIASNGTYLSRISYPPIEAVTLPVDRLGTGLCRMVIRQIEKNSWEPERIYLSEGRDET